MKIYSPYQLFILMLSFTFFALLAGCSSDPKRDEPPEGYFATHIEEDGTKKFQYSIELPERSSKGNRKRRGNASGQVAGGSGGGMSGGVTAGTRSRGKSRPPGGQGNDPSQRINEQLNKMLEEELSTSGFCHEGHRETDWDLEPPLVYVRGECTDKATDKDWSNFSDSSG